MIGNSIADVSALSNLTNLTELYLSVNVISDISALAGLTALDELHLSNNFVSDVSALAGLTNMGFARLNGQRITVPASTVAIPTANPVRDVGGDPVAVSSSDADFTFDPVANEWTSRPRVRRR